MNFRRLGPSVRTQLVAVDSFVIASWITGASHTHSLFGNAFGYPVKRNDETRNMLLLGDTDGSQIED